MSQVLVSACFSSIRCFVFSTRWFSDMLSITWCWASLILYLGTPVSIASTPRVSDQMFGLALSSCYQTSLICKYLTNSVPPGNIYLWSLLIDCSPWLANYREGFYGIKADNGLSRIGRTTDWLTDDWMNDWETDWLTEWMNERQTDWLTDWLNEWRTDWLTNGLTYWMTERMNKWMNK